MKRHRRLIVHRQAVVNNLTTGRPMIKGNFTKLLADSINAVIKEFTLTPGQISASSVGYMASSAGDLAPDSLYGGGTIILVQATESDVFRVQNTGGVPLPGIDGNIVVRIGPYIGPGAILMHWDIDTYSAVIPGIYNYLVSQLTLSTPMRISAAPA